MATGLENFAKVDRTKPDPSVVLSMSEYVPPIYFWLTILDNKPVLMTSCVPWKGLNFGLSFPVDENKVKARMDSKKLITHMKEVASVLSLHGKKILDSNQQIDLKLLNEQEAIRWKLDPIWDKKVKAVDSLIRVKDITEEEAKKLKLL